MIRKLISGTLAALLIAAGLFLPDLIALLSDSVIENEPVYVIYCPEEAFSYIGTAEDKLRALTSYENVSVDYEKTHETEWETVASLPEDVLNLIPDTGEGETKTRTFTLSHKSVPVSFVYTETEKRASGAVVRIIRDAETGKTLIISVTGAHAAIQAWENTRKYSAEGFSDVTGIDAYALLTEYARLNGFSEISDLTGGNSYGGSVSTVKADVKGQPYSLSLTFSESAGTVFYRLIALDGE